MPDTPTPIVLAGATGDLGLRIAAALRERGALVVALVRADGPPAKTQPLRKLGVMLAPVDFADAGALAAAARARAASSRRSPAWARPSLGRRVRCSMRRSAPGCRASSRRITRSISGRCRRG